MNPARPRSKKRCQAVAIPNGNANKYFSYREAWVHIKKARGFHFYLEAVTLEESIIADRLVSFLVCIGEIQAESRIEKYSFGQLIKLWMKRVPQRIAANYFPDLRSAVDQWRQRRNQMVHNIVKSMSGTRQRDVFDFLREAEFVALQREALAHEVTNWVKRMKRQFVKTIQSSSAALA